jgi:hypothetical protein
VTPEEKLELLDLLLGGETPPILVGPISTMTGAPYAVATVKDNVAHPTALSGRTEALLKKYVGVE